MPVHLLLGTLCQTLSNAVRAVRHHLKLLLVVFISTSSAFNVVTVNAVYKLLT